MANENSGRFVWYEYLTSDLRASIGFYSEVVGWKTQPFDQGGYTMWVGSQGPLGGVMELGEEGKKMGGRPFWMAHVQVGDVDATAALARRLGGKVWKEPTDIPTVGRFAIIGDPQGASLSVFRPNQDMPLHDLSKEGEFCWNELQTGDAGAAWKFYSGLFGWKTLEEMDMGPMGTYRVFGVGDTRVGGMMRAPRESPIPPSWLYYATTGDLEAAIGRATRKGGKLLSGPHPVPGGRIAQLTDPQGAVFALHQEAKTK